ncbi:MAG: hypothetical protein OXH00_21495 [Candidatus Poribacteria bacterium]|nr:hypothetical protein [Candidatus Poribacteria bacterium]
MNQKQNLPVEIYEALGETSLLLQGFKPTAVLFTYMNTRGVVVLVYRHGLLEYSVRPAQN